MSVTKGVVSRIGYGPYYAGSTGLIIQVSAASTRATAAGPPWWAAR